jgi:capsular exopolysaccharide synthesis family protein
MSHIFEALQRAETERSGANASAVPESVAELLERAAAPQSGVVNAPATTLPTTPEKETPESPAAELLLAAQPVTPVLGPDSRLVCLTDQGSLAAEKFRVLGLRLRTLREKRPLKRIVITSTIPEEGKTMTAANLALNQSRSKILKTVLIDGDLRRPSLADRFGLSRSLPGLAECLQGEKKLEEVFYKLRNTNLYLVPAGLPPENPLELMQSGRAAEVLTRLGNVFDWVIIDSPPVIPLADTSFWMKLSDGVLLVAREGVTEKKPLKRALEIIDRSTLLGVVVNSCSSSDHKNYYQRYGKVASNKTDFPAAENI